MPFCNRILPAPSRSHFVHAFVQIVYLSLVMVKHFNIQRKRHVLVTFRRISRGFYNLKSVFVTMTIFLYARAGDGGCVGESGVRQGRRT